MGEHGFYHERVPQPRRAVRRGEVAPGPQPDQPGRRLPREADAGGHPHPRPPRARPPHRRPRPAGVARAEDARRARPRHLRPHDLGPRAGVPHRRPGRPGDDEARRDPARPARRVLPQHRHRVHAHPGDRRAALDPVEGRGRAVPALQPGAAPPPRPAERGRGVREVPRHQVRRHQALRAGGGRVGHPHPRHHPVGRRRRRQRRRRARHGPPRPAQRAGQHRRQELRPDLPGVRGLRRPQLGAGLGRREVPPRRGRQVRQPERQGRHRRAGRQPQPPRDRRPGGARHGAGPPGPDRAARFLSRAAAADPRRRRLRRSGRGGRVPGHEHDQRATASAAPSTSSSTTRSASPRRPSTPARRSTPPTWPR